MKAAACVLAIIISAALATAQDWVEPMRQVRQAYVDTDGPDQGTIARFGDSISVSMAYFCPLEGSYSYATPQSQAALDWIQGWVTDDCWDWQANWVEHGSNGSTTSAWPISIKSGSQRWIDYWLANDNAEIGLIMWGTNDVSSGVTVAQYEANMLQVTQTCKANGTIPVLVTPPPKHGANMSGYAQAIHNIAAAENVPVVEYYEECTTRRPHNPPSDTWDGADGMWSAFSGYEVPTLISRDGVHPGNWSRGRSNFGNEPYDWDPADTDPDGLNTNGFNLLNYLALTKCQEVYDNVIVPEPALTALMAPAIILLLARRRKR